MLRFHRSVRSGVNAALNSWTFTERRVKKEKKKGVICLFFWPFHSKNVRQSFRSGFFVPSLCGYLTKKRIFRLFGRPKKQN